MQINNNLILVIKKICKLRFMKKIFIIIIFTVSSFESSLCKDLKNLKSKRETFEESGQKHS